MAITEHTSPRSEGQVTRRRYVRPPRPVHFPSYEEMPETNRHLELRTALYEILKHALADRATIGSEQFIYWDPTTAKKKLAPDVFVKLGPPHAPFDNWKIWLRGAPELAIEVASDSDLRPENWDAKEERYRASGIGEVVRFDPDDAARPVRVWDNVGGDLVEREAPADGVFECAALGLFWIVRPSSLFVRDLRLARDRAGRDLLPTPTEAEARLREQEARARAAAEEQRDREARDRLAAEEQRDRLATEVAELQRRLAERSKAPAKKAPRSAKKAATPARKARG